MAKKIEYGFMTVKEAFLDKWYRIPEYQRPYVWGKEQVEELLNDIYSEAEKKVSDSEYFLGSLVWQKGDHNGQYTEFDLLDGQQRLTTLLLIFAVIRDLCADDTVRRDTCRNSIQQQENKDDGIPERLRIVFDIRSDVEDFVDEYIKPDDGTNNLKQLRKITSEKNADISCSHMAEVILSIRDFFSCHSIDIFFPFLRQQVKMIYVSSENLEDAFHLFNVMNNRGIKLRNSDILKSMNLSKVENAAKRAKYAQQWEDIENYFGEDYDRFLEYIRMILVKKKASASLLKEFETNIYSPREFNKTAKEYAPIAPLLQKGENTFSHISRLFETYKALFDNEAKLDIETQNLITVMQNGFEADFWIAPLMQYYYRFNSEGIEKFVKRLNAKFAADWILGLSLTNRIDSMCKILEAIDSGETADALLQSDVFSFDITAYKERIRGDVYGRSFCKYLLLLANMLTGGNTMELVLPSTVSIEHILPQTPKDDSLWCMDFSLAQREELTNKLGNLMLISRRKNSTLSNNDFAAKKEKYFAKNVEGLNLSFKIYGNYVEWTPETLQKNQSDTVDLIVDFIKRV